MRRPGRPTLSTVAIAVFLSGGPLPIGPPSLGPAVSLAQEGWKAEYEAICSKTDIAMTLSVEELKVLIALCEKLRAQIEKEEESTRKVYLRRLQMCQDLYKYVLSSRESR